MPTQAEQAQILLKLVEMDLKFREEHKSWETQLQKGTRLDEFETKFLKAVTGDCTSEPSRLTGNEWGPVKEPAHRLSWSLHSSFHQAERIIKETQARHNPLIGGIFEWLGMQKRAWFEKRVKGLAKQSKK